MNYRAHFQTRQTPQTQPIPGQPMAPNNAGGYTFTADDWTRLDRFLILGTEGGTYYVTEQKLTRDNAEVVQRCLQADGPRVVQRTAEISQAGRAPKNEPALFALAMAAGLGSDATRQAALAALPQVARTGTHLFTFLEYVEGFRGWGRGLRRAVANWYLRQQPRDLAYQAIKYQQRHGWSHRDALRLAHPQPATDDQAATLKWIAGKYGVMTPLGEVKETPLPVQPLILAFELARAAQREEQITDLIRDHNLPWEAIPTRWLGSPAVWRAILPTLPMTATLRNLGRLTAGGLLQPLGQETAVVVQRLADPEAIRKARLHPMSILVALKTYETGQGLKGSLKWNPLREIVDALDAAFYLAFGHLEPTHQRLLLAIDASGSMNANVNGAPNLTCRQAAVALSLITAAVEPRYQIVAFTEGQHITPLTISPKMRMADAMRELERRVEARGTDCALPINYALAQKLIVDAIIILTDNETWAGQTHPVQALAEYRRLLNPHTKLIVQSMAANHAAIADPADFLTLDIVGFDTATPTLITDFIRSQ